MLVVACVLVLFCFVFFCNFICSFSLIIYLAFVSIFLGWNDIRVYAINLLRNSRYCGSECGHTKFLMMVELLTINIALNYQSDEIDFFFLALSLSLFVCVNPQLNLSIKRKIQTTLQYNALMHEMTFQAHKKNRNVIFVTIAAIQFRSHIGFFHSPRLTIQIITTKLF